MNLNNFARKQFAATQSRKLAEMETLRRLFVEEYSVGDEILDELDVKIEQARRAVSDPRNPPNPGGNRAHRRGKNPTTRKYETPRWV